MRSAEQESFRGVLEQLWNLWCVVETCRSSPCSHGGGIKIQKYQVYCQQNSYHLVFFRFQEILLIIPINPSIPKLYVLPNIHKPDISIRPVVSICGSSCYHLSSRFNDIILMHTNFKSEYAIKKFTELCSQLKKLTIPSSVDMVSFDVFNLFPISHVQDLLSGSVNFDLFQDLVTLVSLVLEQNFFQFNNSKFNNSFDELQDFLKFLNSLQNATKFTFELESLNTMRFLDIVLSRSDNQTNSSFTTYCQYRLSDTLYF